MEASATPQFTPRKSSHPTAIFSLPPKKVIRAHSDYVAQNEKELSVSAGDFFYVINDLGEHYFEVINPLQKTRGIVPSAHFIVIEKGERARSLQPISVPQPMHSTVTNKHDDGFLTMRSSSSGSSTYASPMSPRSLSSFPRRSRPNSNSSGLSDLRDPDIFSPLAHPPSLKSPGSSESGMSPQPAMNLPASIVTASVQNSEIKPGGLCMYTVEVRRDDNMKQVLFRTYDEFWALHIALLNYFPEESGRKNRPRIIPFLTIPGETQQGASPNRSSLSPAFLQQRQQQLNIYLEEIIRLPNHILNSPPMKRFFLLRGQDMQTLLDINFDVSATLIDLISDYNEEGLVKVKVYLREEIAAWNVFDSISFDEFTQQIEDKFRIQLRRISYKDETGALVLLRGDEDLRLILRTYMNKTQFYIE